MRVKVKKIDPYENFIIKNSRRYVFVKNTEEKYHIDNNSTVQDMQDYMDELNNQIPNYMTIQEVQRKIGERDLDPIKILNLEIDMCEKLINQNYKIKDDLRYQMIRVYMDIIKPENEQGFISLEELMYQKRVSKEDPAGVYIIKNISENIYYVGQATRLFFRLNQHFTGKGNKDLYKDYQNGDIFMIKMIRLSESGYESLGLLERDMIKKYAGYDLGYNKTRGNIE